MAGEEALINVTLPSDATGTVIIRVNGTYYYEEFTLGLVNGSVLLSIPDLFEGQYNVTVEYLGDLNYLNGTNTTSFNVTDKLSISIVFNMTGNYTYNETITVNATTNATDMSLFDIYVDGIYVGSVFSSGGLIQFDLDADLLMDYNILPGNHIIRLEFMGDDTYGSCVNETNITISQLDTLMSVNASTVNGVTLVNVTLPESANGMLIVRLNDNPFGYLVDVVNGTAVLRVSNLAPGTYNITVEYLGDAIFAANTTNSSMIVPERNITVNVNDTVYGENATIVVNTTGLAGNVTIFIDGNEYGNATINPATGVAVLNVTGLDVGTHTVSVTGGGVVGFSVFNVDRANAMVAVLLVLVYLM